jgi:putative transposase
MEFNKDIHHRKSIRLREYDYSKPGAYFVTICTHQRQPLFGNILDGGMTLNAAGVMAEKCWRAIPDHFPWSRLGEFIVMPNHVHGIIIVEQHDTVGANDHSPLHNHSPIHDNSYMRGPGTSRSLGSVIRGFKIGVTKWFRTNTDVYSVWQRNYYEHIIRNEQAYQKIAEYICTNPQKWLEDTYYVQAP